MPPELGDCGAGPRQSAGDAAQRNRRQQVARSFKWVGVLEFDTPSAARRGSPPALAVSDRGAGAHLRCPQPANLSGNAATKSERATVLLGQVSLSPDGAPGSSVLRCPLQPLASREFSGSAVAACCAQEQ
jgi:hypothetical protein